MTEKRLRPKYTVFRICPDGKPTIPGQKSTDPKDPDSPFVLMPRKDMAAFQALVIYSRYCEPELGKEIKDWLHVIAAAGPQYGTQGIRNRKYALDSSIDSR